MADEKSQYLRKYTETSISHSLHTMTSNDVMTELEEEDKVSLPLSDEEMLSFKPWEKTEREFILHNYKDTSIFSCNSNSFPEIGCKIQNHNIFSSVKGEYINSINERGHEDFSMENIEEITGNHNHGEEFCPHDSSPVDHCLNARQGNTSSFNFYKDVPRKSGVLSSYNDYLRFKDRKKSDNIMGMSDMKLKGYYECSNLNQSALEIFKNRHGEPSKEESVVNEMSELSHNPDFLTKTMSGETDERMISAPEKRKEKLPGFWWLKASSKWTNGNDNCNSVSSLNVEMGNLSKNSTEKLENINSLTRKSNQSSDHHSYNSISSKHSSIQADYLNSPFLATCSNLYSSDSDHQNYSSYNKPDSDKEGSWWKRVKRVNLPDSPYGFTQSKFEMTMKNIHQDTNKINYSRNIIENASAVDVKMTECDFSSTQLSEVYDKDLKESEIRTIKLQEEQKKTVDLGNLENSEKLLNKSTTDPKIEENRTIARLDVNDPEKSVEQEGGHQYKLKDLHDNFTKSTRLEDTFKYNAMSILRPPRNDCDEIEQEVSDHTELENWKMDREIPEEYSISDKEKSVTEKCNGFGSNNSNHENFAQNEKEAKNNELEDAEFSAKYDNMLVLEVIKIENKIINEINREQMLEHTMEKMDDSFKDHAGKACNEDYVSIRVSRFGNKTEIETSIEGSLEESHKNFIYAGEKEAEETECEEFKEAEGYYEDKLNRENLKVSGNYSNSDINAFNKNNSFGDEEKDFKSNANKIFEKDKEFLNKNILDRERSENEINDIEENPENNMRLENFIMVENNSKNFIEEPSKNSVAGIKTSDEIDDKCDYVLKRDLCCLNSKECLDKDMDMTESMMEVSFKTEFTKEQITLPEGRIHILQLYEDNQRNCMKYQINSAFLHSENNGGNILGIDCGKDLDIQEHLLLDGKDHVLLGEEIVGSPQGGTYISEDVVHTSDQDLKNECKKNSPSIQVLKDTTNLTNSSLLAFEQDEITVEEFPEVNISSLIESSPEKKPVCSDSLDTLNLKQDPDLNHYLIDDHSEDWCCELENHTIYGKKHDFSLNKRNIFSNLSDKESNYTIIKIKRSQKENILSKKLGSLSTCVEEKNESPNAAMKVISENFCSLMNGWNSVLMRNVMNMNFVQIRFRSTSNHKVSNVLLKNFIYDFRKENNSNFHLDNDHQNVDTLYETDRIADEDINFNLESANTAIVDVNKLNKRQNELDCINFAEVMELDYHNNLVSGYESSKTMATNNVGNCKLIEKWLLDAEECFNDSSEEIHIDTKSDDHYDGMLTDVSLRTSESPIDIRLNKNSSDEEENQWAQSMNYEIKNNSFEIDNKYKEMDEIVKNLNEPKDIPFSQEHDNIVKTSDEEDLENILISDKKFSCLSNFNITQNFNLMEDEGYPFDDESLYSFNPWETASVAKQSQKTSVEDYTGRCKSLGTPSILETDHKVPSSVEVGKQENSQSTDNNSCSKKSLFRHSDIDEESEVASLIDEEELEDSSFSICPREKMVEEEILKYKSNFDREDFDDSSLDSYLSAIIEKHCKSEELSPTLKCDHPEYKKMTAINVECQTEISGLLNKFHTRSCMDKLIISANENEICHNYGNKSCFEALNLEIARNKIVKCWNIDNSHSSFDRKQGEYNKNQTKKRTSSQVHISVKEKEDFPNKKIKVNALEENIDKILQLEEDEWSEITGDRITTTKSFDQKVPDVTPIIKYPGVKEEYSKECPRKTSEENNANIREVPSVPNIPQRTSVLRLGLSKRARPRPLHKVQ